MARVTVYAKLMRGASHVHSSTSKDGACILFVPHLEVNGHYIRTEHPDTEAWRKAGWPDELRPDDPWPQSEISMGEGFVVLTIKHANNETWAYLSSLPDDYFGEGSSRESFDVLVSEFEYILLEPGDEEPWAVPRQPVPTLEIPVPAA